MKDKNEDGHGAFDRARDIINQNPLILPEEKKGIFKLIQVLIEAAEISPNPPNKNTRIKTFTQEIISKDSLMVLVKQQADELDALKSISMNLTSSLDLQTVLDAVVSEA
ncbi:MAG: hypothetical protein Q8K73_04050, partial [Anaerolineales bacterium]|nr:hypothetical protein [Anaerolineales bacterium]